VEASAQKRLDAQKDHSEMMAPGEQKQTILFSKFMEKSLLHSGFIRESFSTSHTAHQPRNVFILTRNDSIESINDLSPFILLILMNPE
jgi:hypothetical protein